MTRRFPIMGTLALTFVAGALTGIAADRPAALDHGPADVTWTDTRRDLNPFDAAAADTLWGECVIAAHLSGRAGDGDLNACDNAWAELTHADPHDSGLHLWCPDGDPAMIGCYGTRSDDFWARPA